jgi:hypothetical protein
MCLVALCREQCNCFFVEGYEGFPTQPCALIRNHAMSKIATRIEDGQTSIHCGPVQRNIFCVAQLADRSGNVGPRHSVAAVEGPNQLT